MAFTKNKPTAAEMENGIPRSQSAMMPPTQPTKNPVLARAGCRDSSISVTAMIGIGLIALSLVVVTGYAGQVSLAQLAVGRVVVNDGVDNSNTAVATLAVAALSVKDIIICGHSHCGAIRAAYEGVPEEAVALTAWLKLVDEALLPVQPSPEAMRRTEHAGGAVGRRRIVRGAEAAAVERDAASGSEGRRHRPPHPNSGDSGDRQVGDAGGFGGCPAGDFLGVNGQGKKKERCSGSHARSISKI